MEYEIKRKLYPWEEFAIETDRLRLSVIRKNYAKEVTGYFIRNKSFHQKWAQTHSDNYFTERVQKAYLHHDVTEFKNDRLVPLWISLKDEPGKLLGRVSFFNFAYGGMMSCSVGYHLDNQAVGNGYMTEAVMASCNLLKNELKLHRIEAFILPENIQSQKLILRCGFKEEGIRYSYMHINGQWRDHKSYYLLLE